MLSRWKVGRHFSIVLRKIFKICVFQDIFTRTKKAGLLHMSRGGFPL